MSAETSFRVVLGMVFALTILITAIHRFKAAQSGEKISREKEGYLFAIVLRLVGLSLFVVTLAYLIDPQSVQWAMVAIPSSIRWTGAVTGILSSLLMYWTLSSLGMNLTDTVVIRANATLITNGPYRWVRHPFYLTTAIVIISVTLLTANCLIGFLSLVVLIMLALRTPLEEKILIERFGQKYRDYKASTGRFFPRFKRPN